MYLKNTFQYSIPYQYKLSQFQTPTLFNYFQVQESSNKFGYVFGYHKKSPQG